MVNNLTFAEFLNLLKDKNEEFINQFREILTRAQSELNGAFVWECPPVSQKTLNNPLEFVIIKKPALDKINHNWNSFSAYLTDSTAPVISFDNRKTGSDYTRLVIPNLVNRKDGSRLDYKNLVNFTRHAPLKQQAEFWQVVGEQMLTELGKDQKPKWLSTHGLGVSHLHVRICNSPKYYSYQEYEKEKNQPQNTQNEPPSKEKNLPLIEEKNEQDQKNNPKLEINAPIHKWKEKILRNLDKITFDCAGHIASAEIMKDPINGCRKTAGAYQIKIDDEEINLLEFEKAEWEKDYLEIKNAVVNNIKQNIADWEIKKDPDNKDILQNKKTGVKVWKMIFSNLYENGEKDWAEIETTLKNPKFSATEPEGSPKTNYQNDKLLLIGGIGGVIMLGIIVFILWPKKNKKN